MTELPEDLIERFADVFAAEKSGFSAKEIVEYFALYGPTVSMQNDFGGILKRHALFCKAVKALGAKEQYYALADLCTDTPATKYGVDEEEVSELQGALHTSFGTMPIGLCFSDLTERAIRAAWCEALLRLSDDPAAAITAARSLVEATAKTIIAERGGTPDDSGDLVRLVRQAEEVVGIGGAAGQSEHQVLTGLASAATGIAAISNAAGDRHGAVGGAKLEDEEMAGLVVNACGTITLFLVNRHLLSPKA